MISPPSGGQQHSPADGSSWGAFVVGLVIKQIAQKREISCDGLLPVAVGAEHEPVEDDVLLDEKVHASLTPVDVSDKNVGSVVALLSHDESEHFRRRWSEVQGKFVDEPQSAVQQADALVAEVIDNITAVFAKEHSSLEGQWKEGKDVSTEDRRQALQHCRSFFNRLVI